VKFLCDQCKAKYQISDDKVAGKTVRMKCRKCGHLIEVRAAVTETSVAGALREGSSSSEPPPAPGTKATQKPSALPKSPLATSLAQAKPPVPRPGAAKEAGLANAFKSSMMQTKEDEAALLELSSADEWYAAINGVPVGPIRIGELRRKAALGAVTDDSLVWQEGMEEWRPVKTIPELASLVREAAMSGRVSLVTPEPPTAGRGSVIPPSPSMRPAPPQRPAPPARSASEPPRPPAAPAAAARSNVVPITSRLATAERLEEAPSPTSERLSVAPDPFAAPGAAAAAGAIPPAAPVPAFAAPASAQQPVIVQMPRQPNYVGIGMILAMVAFGGVAAWALFFKAPPPPAPTPTIVTQYLPAPTAPPTAAASQDTNAAPSDSAAAAASAKSHTGGGVAAAPKPSASAADLKSLGLGGPNPLAGLAPTGPAAPAGPSGGTLSEGQLTTVVKMHKPGLTRTCWTNIGGGGSSSASETAHMVIDGSGHVSSVHAEGTNGQVGTCMEREMRNWIFPASGAQTSVDLPFKFVNQ
jgi:predicted Zn finger-like uncharacterized protein